MDKLLGEKELEGIPLLIFGMLREWLTMKFGLVSFCLTFILYSFVFDCFILHLFKSYHYFSLLANKQDLPYAVSVKDIVEKLNAYQITSRPWHIQACCASEGGGLVDGMTFLLSWAFLFRCNLLFS
jgi:hypothetical protein